MGMLRFLLTPAATIALALPLAATASAQTKITVGKVIGSDGFHIPTYVAMDKGFYKEEGLDARFVELSGKGLVTAALGGNINFVPIPSGGSQAALSGAKITYVVGESLISQWTIVTPKDINKPEDLKGKTLGFGRPGGADYDEAEAVLHRFFHMDAGKDYKVISFQGEPERIAAMINGDIQGSSMSIPEAAASVAAGLKVLIRCGDYIQRAGGTIWGLTSYVEKNQDTTKKLIRAIAKAIMYFRDNRDGSIPIIKKYLAIKTDAEAGAIWDELHDAFGAEVPKDLFEKIFESRRKTMIAARQWPENKPLPDTEQFLARNLLETTLKEMNYVPTKRAGLKTN